MPVIVQGGAVSFDEESGSPVINIGREKRQATRVGRILWTAIDTAIAECFPALPSAPGAYPGVAYLFVEAAQFEPHHPEGAPTAGGSVNVYDYAKATIQYSTLDYDPTERVSRKYSFGGEVLMYPSGSVRWSGETVAVKSENVSAGKIIPMIDWHFTYHRVPTAQVPWSIIRSLIGKVNNGPFEGAGSETVLFMGAEITSQYGQSGELTWQIDYKFQERLAKQGSQSVGWNYFWRDDASGGAKWEELETTKGDKIYPVGDFSALY